MKKRLNLYIVLALCTFAVSLLLGSKAFTNESSILAQQNQAGPSRGPSNSSRPTSPKSKQPAETPPTSKQLPAPPTPPPRYTPPPTLPGTNPIPKPRVPVIPPPGMELCTIMTSAGVEIAIIVPIGSSCHNNANGSVTVTFPCAVPPCPTLTIPAGTTAAIFYSGSNPVIIVPYYNSTVTYIPETYGQSSRDHGYRITFPDGSVYFLPVPGKGDIFFWISPPAPIPLLYPPVRQPGTWMVTCTNSAGAQIVIIAPNGSSIHCNPDGSVTIIFWDGSSMTIPDGVTNTSLDSIRGWHVIVMPYGSTIWNWGSGGYWIHLPDGTWRYDLEAVYYPYSPQPDTTPPLPNGIELASYGNFYDFFTYVMGPRFSGYLQVVGEPGITYTYSGDMLITFPDGSTYYYPMGLLPGAYTVNAWQATPPPGHTVVHHFAIIPRGSTITQNPDGTYHCVPPEGWGSPFDFESP